MTDLYAVTDHGSTTLMLVAAGTPLEALDAYAVREGFPAYSSLDDVADFVYELPESGLTGAVFTNQEILAVPVAGPVLLSVGLAGWGVVDAAGLWLTDAHDTADEARRVVLDAAGDLELEVASIHDAERDGEQDGERAYEIASADVVLTLTRDEAATIAEVLGDVAGSRFLGENGDYDEVGRLAALVRRQLEVEVQS